VGVAVAVWSTSSRLSQANENIFARIDKSLAAARDRVLAAQKRVQESKVTMEDIEQSVRNWTRKEAGERLTSRLELEKRAERLAASLRQADTWLELSGASIQGVQQVIEVATSLGARVDTSMVDTLLERLAALQRQLKQSTETIDAIHEQLAKTADGKALDERINQVAQLALRVVATLGQTDSRLGEFSDRLADTQGKGERLKNKTDLYITIAQISAFLLVAWMTAGQISLYRSGWKTRPQSRSAA
jgi:hypothetical protein